MGLRQVGRQSKDKAIRISLSTKANARNIALALVSALCILAATNVRAERRVAGNEPITTSPSSIPAFTLTANLPSGIVGRTYSGSIIASGGVAPYNFAITDGALPAGLFLNSSTGAVTGTPSSAVTKYFWVRATDSQGAAAKLHVQITISGGTTSSVISVSVSPSSASVTSGNTQPFTATVQGTANTAVTWAASSGTISSGGLFTAPSVDGTITVTITATSVADTTKRASATVSVSHAASTTISLAVSPSSASVTSGNTQPFSATVQGTTNTAVTWSASSGTISSSGLFTAPSVSSSTTVTITATSAADTTKKASATVTVSPLTAGISVSVSPNSASLTAGNSKQFAATVQGTSNTAVTWSATAGSISSSGMFTAPTVSSNTNVTVTATSAADTTKKSNATVSVTPATTTLAVTTASVPGAQSGVAYSYPISASGGTTPYQWKVASGSLPQGFVLSSTGQLGGTTTQTGQFSFAAQVTDAGSSTASQTFSFSVSAPTTTPPTTGTSDGPAQLPQTYVLSAMVDTPAPGSTTLVSAGGNLQTALNNANCGDTIELAAGATFSGQFTLPAKACDDQHWIIVRTSAPDSSLPAEGSRMTPCYSGVSSLPGRPSFNCSSAQHVLARVVFTQTGSGPFQLAPGANHYRLLGLEISRAAGTGLVGQLISAAGGTANHIIVDRSWLHGSPQDDTMSAFSLNGITYAALVDSYTTDFHCTSLTGACTDAHVVAGGTSSTADGKYRIVGNFLEASGENILFGGGGASTTPTDIEIRKNHFFKPFIWMSGQSGFVGGSSGNPFIVKNHLELKNAIRVLIEGNIFENSWGGFSQVGYSILLTPKNQAGSNGTNICPICAVTDVTIRYNTISHVGAGISLADILSDNGGAALAGERYSIHDITIDDISVSKYKGSGTLLMVFSAWPTNVLNNVYVNHITGFPDPGSRIMDLGAYTSSTPMYGFTLSNSIVGQSIYPVWSTGGGTANCAYYDVPLTSLNLCFPAGYNFKDNALIAVNQMNFPPSKWPASNYFPSSASAVSFVNFNGGNGGDYHLLSGSPYKNAGTDGKDLGADIDAILTLTSNVY